MRDINPDIRTASSSCRPQLNPDNKPAKNGQIVSSAEAKSTADLKVKYYSFNFTDTLCILVTFSTSSILLLMGETRILSLRVT